MTTITFTIPDKYENKKSAINGLINQHNGEFTYTETKDGGAYIVDFKNDNEGKEFDMRLNALIPDLYMY